MEPNITIDAYRISPTQSLTRVTITAIHPTTWSPYVPSELIATALASHLGAASIIAVDHDGEEIGAFTTKEDTTNDQ